MEKVVHFEIPVDDLVRVKKFYSSIFGWEITDWPMPGGVTYTGVRTVPVDEKTFMPKEYLFLIDYSQLFKTHVNF